MKKKFLGICLVLTCVLLAGCANAGNEGSKEVAEETAAEAEDTQTKDYIVTEPTDYSDKESWFRNDYDNPEKPTAKADVIFFNGTSVFEADQENGVGDIDDKMKSTFQVLYDTGVSVFDDGTRMYAPYYRQISSEFATEAYNHNDLIDLMRATEVKDDIFASLDYYFENYNEGRPFIIGGQSQGGAAVQIALEDYFGQEENRVYLDNMVAAYSVAYGVDKNWLNGLDYLKFAEGETDTGVVISWNTEGAGDKEKNFLLAENQTDTLVINPINWKTDDTYAEASECPSSLIDGEVVEPGQFNLQVDPSRGSVICDNCEQYVATETTHGVLWGGKSLHTQELALAYGSIRQNMHDRIDAYLAKEKVSMVTDYTKSENWAVFEKDGTEKVDTVFFCPSLVTSSKTGTGTGLPEEMLPGIDTVLNGQVAVFEDSTNVYVPLYRQQVFDTNALTAMDMSDPVHWMFDLYRTHPAYEDCEAALDYYFENCNDGKPFIIAGHSQGSALVHIILEKYMKNHPDYYERMVAAYAIGMATPKDFMEANPHLKYATGKDDTGVIISYNTEGPGAEGTNMVLCDNSYVINPINWKTDDTYAPAEDNLGSYVDGEIVMNFADAQINFERYSVVSTADRQYGALVDYTGTKCLHGDDYQLYMNNLKENVKTRTDAFLGK